MIDITDQLRQRAAFKPSINPAILPTMEPATCTSNGITLPPSQVLTLQADNRERVVQPKFFYDGKRFFMDNGQHYVPIQRTSLRSHLKQAGHLNPDFTINKIEADFFVNYAGPVAGMMRGFYPQSTRNILVTCSPCIIEPSPGEWPTINAVISGLFAGTPEQLNIFKGWVKFGYDALSKHVRRPGQAMVLSGPRNCGKSLLIDLVEVILGGRRAHPYQRFTGATDFNGQFAGAELLVIDDEAGTTDYRARVRLGAAIKSHLFGGSVEIHAKNATPVSLSPFWRLIIACNDEPDSLLVLPPLSEDLEDKLSLLKCERFNLPMPVETIEEREAFWSKLVSEVPAFLHHLRQWTVPEHLQERRCGVVAFHHPDLVAAVHALSPECQLLSLIDLSGIDLPFVGTSNELHQDLLSCSSVAQQVKQLLASNVACGRYLGRLAKDGRRVFTAGIINGIQHWRVQE